MIDRILIATDGSPHSLRALDLAANIAARFSSRLLIAHVLMHGRPAEELERMAEIEHLIGTPTVGAPAGTSMPPGGLIELSRWMEDTSRGARLIEALGEQLLDSASERARAIGVRTIDTRTASGDYADQILDLAGETGADLIVLGRRGLGRLREVVLGSVSQKVLHHAGRPVLTVP